MKYPLGSGNPLRHRECRLRLFRAHQGAASQTCVLGAFLARDISVHPERLRAVDASLPERIRSLVGNLDVYLDDPHPAEDE